MKMSTSKTHEDVGRSALFLTQGRDLHWHRDEHLPRLGDTSLPSVTRLLIMGMAHFCTPKESVQKALFPKSKLMCFLC